MALKKGGIPMTLDDSGSPSDRAAVHAVYVSADFQQLSRLRGRLSWLLTGITLVLYVGFFLWVAFGPSSLSTRIPVVGSSGLLVYLLMSLAAFALVAVYLRFTTRRIVPLQDAVAARSAQGTREGAGA
ncbi:DUF485 domain-containing protein [Streptomyces sp. NBC_01476]|uniref:DUF485 domain-containing protein n=1 Tax=Streptomyces sp. NBC_01476 TaxID=2903881 RepID=UPI002E35CCBB|nr:DUF485 domain-containing protein [Streptomyces sp. NBC_01476]